MLDEIRSHTESARRAIDALLGTLAAKRQRITEKHQEIERVRLAYIPDSELEERIAGVVELHAERWIARHALELERQLCAPGLQPKQVTLPRPEEMNSFDAVCAGAPDLAREMLRAIVARLSRAGEAGLPSAERARVIEQLARELAALEADEEAVVDEALGLHVPGVEHRPDVLERRARSEKEAQTAEASRTYWLEKDGGLFLDSDIRMRLQAREITGYEARDLQSARDDTKRRAVLTSPD